MYQVLNKTQNKKKLKKKKGKGGSDGYFVLKLTSMEHQNIITI